MSLVASHIQSIPYSGIRKFFDIANEVEGVISLGVGEPDFGTPWACKERAIYTLEQGKTTYTSNAGLLELRQEISKYIKNTLDLDYCCNKQVLVTVGASEGIDIALRSVISQGDEVLIVEPCFVSYKPCVIMCGGVPISIRTQEKNDFRLTPEDLENKITSKTKAILLSYPNNPTGAIMEKQDFQKIVDILKDKDILIISDEIYSELTYDNKTHVSIAQFKEVYNKTVILNGFSKSFAMTGWRLGFAVGPEDIISAMTKIHQYIIMCAPTLSQYAGIEALTSCLANVDEMKREYNRRRLFMLSGFREIGLECFEPKGAFYLFPNIKSTGLSSSEFCERLVYEQKVAVVPGTAFGECGEGYIRCSYAYSIEEIKEALSRIQKFIKNL